MTEEMIIAQGSCFSELAKSSWNALKGKWGVTIGTLFIAFCIQAAANYIPVVGLFSGILLFPLTVGCSLFMLRVVRDEQPLDIGTIFQPFDHYLRYIWAYIRIFIFCLLWTLLLIIPGIIAGIRYSMTIFIMLDDPQCSAKDAMTESIVIMYGHKWQFFGYSLLFSLIFFLGTLCTLGIGLFWLIPWSGSFMASFYESVRRRPVVLDELPELEPVPESEPPRDDPQAD
jgi:uncharacterized membrane protein